jgi:hypothetical protein
MGDFRVVRRCGVRENIVAKRMDGDGLIRGRSRRCCGEGGIEGDR